MYSWCWSYKSWCNLSHACIQYRYACKTFPCPRLWEWPYLYTRGTTMSVPFMAIHLKFKVNEEPLNPSIAGTCTQQIVVFCELCASTWTKSRSHYTWLCKSCTDTSSHTDGSAVYITIFHTIRTFQTSTSNVYMKTCWSEWIYAPLSNWMYPCNKTGCYNK